VRVLFDTTVLVAWFLEYHPDHATAWSWAGRVQRREVRGIVALHSLSETWSVISAFPRSPVPSTESVAAFVLGKVAADLEVVTPSIEDYRDAIGAMALAGIRGGAIFDALILQAARKAKADLVLTFDVKDFRRVAPDLAKRIRSP